MEAWTRDAESRGSLYVDFNTKQKANNSYRKIDRLNFVVPNHVICHRNYAEIEWNLFSDKYKSFNIHLPRSPVSFPV